MCHIGLLLTENSVCVAFGNMFKDILSNASQSLLANFESS